MVNGRVEIPQIRLIAWEITRSCNLNCRHCRAAANAGPYCGELTTRECEDVLRKVSEYAKPIIILTGGEPMLRPDIYHLSEYGTRLGLHMVMAPCGALLTEENCEKLVKAGIKRISLSIDGANEKSHDSFRRVTGAFASVLKGAENAKKVGLPFQINTTITKINIEELPEIFELAIKLGAVSFHPFLLVPTGRGKELEEYEISAVQYEKVLNWIYENRNKSKLTMKPTCAPHYYRIYRQREKREGRGVVLETHGPDAMTKGCLGGQGFAFISYKGTVQMCGFLDIPAGDLRTSSFDFGHIWETSPFFNEIRNYNKYQGRCGRCEFITVCGGCRARAYASTGNYLAEEPYCIYNPNGLQEDR
ncbi:MAG TPA: radical SAM protein [Chitinispirillaceae bacterium]|nr:radical SAM protein [Chitinispirillaceae bacterium]